jgi:hypothetical protein
MAQQNRGNRGNRQQQSTYIDVRTQGYGSGANMDDDGEGGGDSGGGGGGGGGTGFAAASVSVASASSYTGTSVGTGSDIIPITADNKTKAVINLVDRFVRMHLPEGGKKAIRTFDIDSFVRKITSHKEINKLKPPGGREVPSSQEQRSVVVVNSPPFEKQHILKHPNPMSSMMIVVYSDEHLKEAIEKKWVLCTDITILPPDNSTPIPYPSDIGADEGSIENGAAAESLLGLSNINVHQHTYKAYIFSKSTKPFVGAADQVIVALEVENRTVSMNLIVSCFSMAF